MYRKVEDRVQEQWKRRIRKKQGEQAWEGENNWFKKHYL
jgi:hypothetical protein